MSLRRFRILARRRWRRSPSAQAALIGAIWLAAESLVRWTGVPVPGAVAALGVVLALLATGAVRLPALRRGARALIGHMLLFFVPAVLAVRAHPEFLGPLGVKLAAAILAGTFMVMAATGLAVEAHMRLRARGRGDGALG